MIGTQRSWNANPTLLQSFSAPRKAEPVVMPGTAFQGQRSAISLAEPEDVHLTGMTRSLDRRLLALNLKPAASVLYAAPLPSLKVA